jgi:O-antigen/teichoic acid export membrane protein
MTDMKTEEQRPMLGRLGRASTAYSAGILATANLTSIVLRLLGGIIVARFIVPEELGTFNGILLVVVYAGFLQAGVINGLNRELPYFIGKGDRPRAEGLAACSMAWALSCSGIAGAAALGWAAWQAVQGDWKMAWGWVVVTIALAGAFPRQYLESTMRSGAEFVRLGIAHLLGGIVGFALLVLVWKLGFFGLGLRLMVVTVLEIGILWRWRVLRVWPRFSKQELWHLLKIGLPIFVVSYTYSAWRSLDSALIVNSLGRAQLGLYQIAVLTVSAGISVPLALGQVVYPRMSQRYGQTGDARAALRIAYRPMALLGVLAIPAVAAGWFLLPPFVRWVLPKYVAGIPAARWALATVYLLCFGFSLNIYNVIRKQVVYACLIAASAGAFLAAVPWRLAHETDPLVAYVQAMVVGTGVYVIAGNLVALRLTRRRSPGVATVAAEKA